MTIDFKKTKNFALVESLKEHGVVTYFQIKGGSVEYQIKKEILLEVAHIFRENSTKPNLYTQLVINAALNEPDRSRYILWKAAESVLIRFYSELKAGSEDFDNIVCEFMNLLQSHPVFDVLGVSPL